MLIKIVIIFQLRARIGHVVLFDRLTLHKNNSHLGVYQSMAFNTRHFDDMTNKLYTFHPLSVGYVIQSGLKY